MHSLNSPDIRYIYQELVSDIVSAKGCLSDSTTRSLWHCSLRQIPTTLVVGFGGLLCQTVFGMSNCLVTLLCQGTVAVFCSRELGWYHDLPPEFALADHVLPCECTYMLFSCCLLRDLVMNTIHNLFLLWFLVFLPHFSLFSLPMNVLLCNHSTS